MEKSDRYDFYLPSRDVDDIADVNQFSDNFRKIDTKLGELEDNGGAYYDQIENLKDEVLRLKNDIDVKIDEEKANRIFASAIRNTASGSIVAITDISPIEHTLDVKVRSKNIIPYPYYTANTNAHGITYNIGEDGRFVANGITTTGTNFYFAFTLELAPATYTYSYQGTFSADNEAYLFIHSLTTQQTLAALIPTKKETTFTITEKMTVRVYLNIPLGGVNVSCDLYPQLELGTEATPYTPYVDVSTANVNKIGKNLIPCPYTGKTKTENGTTYTDNGDGSITVNGTAIDNSYFSIQSKDDKRLYIEKGQVYTLNVLPIVGSFSTIYAYVIESDGTEHYEIGDSNTFVANSSGYVSVSFVVVKGFITNNLLIKPQLEVGSTATEYEPYIEPTTYPISADGTVEGVTSLYPTTTLISDTEGVVIDVEYNVDTKKYIDNKFAELAAMIINS